MFGTYAITHNFFLRDDKDEAEIKQNRWKFVYIRLNFLRFSTIFCQFVSATEYLIKNYSVPLTQ